MIQVAAERNAAMDFQSELSQLKIEHEDLEGQLSELDDLIYLTPEEQIERKNIQKRKLQLKDRIALLRAAQV